MLGKDKLIAGSRFVVHLGLIVNRAFLAAVTLGLLLSFIFGSRLAGLIVHQDSSAAVQSEILGLRLMALMGVLMAVATDRLFVALARIIASARAGDPFIAENARRLRIIGWALLALQLLDIPCDLISRHFPFLSSAGAPGDTFSPGGWLAVLMVFVLSRVFAVGSAMRDELEGTV